MKKLTSYLFIFIVSVSSLYCGKWSISDTLYIYLTPNSIGKNPVNYEDIECTDSLNCYALANQNYTYPLIRVTHDGGQTWESFYTDTISSKKNPLGLQGKVLVYIDTTFCMVFMQEGRYMVSRDNLRTWETGSLGIEYELLNADFEDREYGIAVSWYNSFVTYDGGRSWDSIHVNIEDQFRPWLYSDVDIINGRTYMLCYNSDLSDYIIVSDDSSKSWKFLCYLPQSASQLYMVNDSVGYAVGKRPVAINSSRYYDVIHKTRDGWKTYEVQLDTLAYARLGLWRADFFDENNGVAISAWMFHLWMTRDGGKHWVFDTSYTNKNVLHDFKAVHFLGSPRKFLGVTGHGGGEIILYTETEPEVSVEAEIETAPGFSAYPNPVVAGSPINVKIPTTAGLCYSLSIYNETGLEVDEVFKFTGDGNTLAIKYELSHNQPPGAYFIRVYCPVNGLSAVYPIVVYR